MSGLAVDSGGRVYVADDVAGAIVRLDADGTAVVVIRRVAGGAVADGVTTDQASVGALGQAAMSAAGLLFIDDRSVRSIAER